jgi:hypothetical protein
MHPTVNIILFLAATLPCWPSAPTAPGAKRYEDHSRVNNPAVAGSQPVRGSVQGVNAIEERQQVAVEIGPFKR